MRGETAVRKCREENDEISLITAISLGASMLEKDHEAPETA